MKLLKQEVDVQKFFKKIQKGSVLILDYDGTLAPLIPEREKAVPYTGVKKRLHILSMIKKTSVVIVSGRSLDDLIKFVGKFKIELWGSHGLERRFSNGKRWIANIDSDHQKGLQKAFGINMENLNSQSIEIKPFSIALHWRGMKVEEQLKIAHIEKIWGKIAPRYGLEVHHFDEGIELRASYWNKGDVVHVIVEETPRSIPIAYLGDDVTDEQAFFALKNRGLKVLVKKKLRNTLADVQITPPQELLKFLDEWIKHARVT